MKHITADEAKRFVVAQLAHPIAAKGLIPENLPDNFDLLTEGIIDSLGFVDLVMALERYFDIKVDFGGLDPESLTVLGPISQYIAEKSRVASSRST
ncbi:MAG: hypothetical protein AUH11_20310 [Acidobacteria bacterium 13_2_20CM_57_17]|nr:MAG: hypothetical protein AUH11_20310 [Acidobacteria bacterium 13_2_20CM_57_17]PYU50387.1 MAG: hypothetical protein DMG48_13785 [Acidobacteriota bacterium]